MTEEAIHKTRRDMVRERFEAIQNANEKRGRKLVPIDQLVEDPNNERQNFRDMQGLIESVKSVGIVEPITVAPIEGGRLQIITGHRRFRAAKAAGLPHVEVLIRDSEDAVKRRLKSIISNLQRADVGPVELARGLRGLMDADPRIQTQEDLAKVVGKDKQWISGMLRILTLPLPLQEKVGTSQLAVSCDAMIKIARIEDVRLQEELVEVVLSGNTVREIRRRISMLQTPRGRRRVVKAPTTPLRLVFPTSFHTEVIVQQTSNSTAPMQVIEALQDALQQARAQKDEETLN